MVLKDMKKAAQMARPVMKNEVVVSNDLAASIASSIKESMSEMSAAVDKVLQQNARMVLMLESMIKANHESTMKALSRAVEVKSGNVNVKMPRKPDSFIIAYGDDGRPERLIREDRLN